MSAIVAAGLILLIATIFVISLMISAAIKQDDKDIALLENPPSEVNIQLVLRQEKDEAVIGLLTRGLQEHDVASITQAASLIRLRREDKVGMVRGMYSTLFIGSVVFLLIGLWFTQQIIVAPVEELDRIANRIASGDLDTSIVLEGQGEFRDLARTFETMRLKLRSSREQLTSWTRNLEFRVSQRTQELAALSQVIAAASRSLESDVVLQTALDQSLQVVGAESGGLWIQDENTKQLKLVAWSGLSDAMRTQVRALELGEGATGRAALNEQTIVLEDISQAPQLVKDIAIHEGIKSLVAVPIRIHNRVIGVLNVMTHQIRIFTAEEIALLTSIGQQIGIAVDSLRLMHEVRAQTQQVASLQERERIGNEIHDGLLQTLSYLYLKLDQIEKLAAAHELPDLAAQLSSQREVVEATSHDMRRFISDLREMPPPPPISLETAMTRMIDNFRKDNAMSVTLLVEGQPLLLQTDTSTHLIRIAQEALVNAARHGHAHHSKIKLSSTAKQAELCIEDDGSGFVPGILPDDGRKHFGMDFMRARASHIGAVFCLESQPGAGTRIRVTWPRQS